MVLAPEDIYACTGASMVAFADRFLVVFGGMCHMEEAGAAAFHSNLVHVFDVFQGRWLEMHTGNARFTEVTVRTAPAIRC